MEEGVATYFSSLVADAALTRAVAGVGKCARYFSVQPARVVRQPACRSPAKAIWYCLSPLPAGETLGLVLVIPGR